MTTMRDALYQTLVPALRLTNALARRGVGFLHLLQFKVEGFLRPDAEWFDHQLDVYWQWPALGRSSFLERGVLNSLAIKPGGRVLELCSGDGFNSSRFYATHASSVLGLDNNREALNHARRVNCAPNVRFDRADIREPLPPGPFDNVIWDAALTHFVEPDVKCILTNVKKILTPAGVFSGYTNYEPASDYSYDMLNLPNADSLAAILINAFSHVYIRQSSEGERMNYYFFCSTAAEALPFSPKHPDVLAQYAAP